MATGPIALFDKSFLQSLTVDESVWFDNFFLANVCPVFYVETLADLEKPARREWTPEQEVAVIAAKFPDMHGSPMAHHRNLCVGNLLGHAVPMTGQVVLSGGRMVNAPDGIGVIHERSPESEAFSRWMLGEFTEVERLFASAWREGLAHMAPGEIAAYMKRRGITGKTCKSFRTARAISRSLSQWAANPEQQLQFGLTVLGVPHDLRPQIVERWRNAGRPAFAVLAPYAAFMLEVEVFYQVSVAAGLISGDKAASRMDIAYLYYLPFCMLFVSSDRLHRESAPLFMRADQDFVSGGELKSDLQRIDRYYRRLPEEKKAEGVMVFAKRPPREAGYVVAGLWDRHLGSKWETDQPTIGDPAKQAETLADMKRWLVSPPLDESSPAMDQEGVQFVSIERQVRRRKGNWLQVPEDAG